MDKSNTLKYLLVFLAAFLWLFLGSNFGINIYDEGIGLVGSARILHGDMPYIDFWTVYSPAWYYVEAVFMQIFSENLLALRAFSLVLDSLVVLVIFIIFDKKGKKPYFPALAALMFISLAPGYGRSMPLSMLLVCIILYCLLNIESRRRHIKTAVLSFILFTVRHDFGVYIFTAVVFFLLFEKIILMKEKDYKNLFVFVSIFFSCLTLYIVGLNSAGLLGGYFYQAYVFVFNNFAASRSLPFPNPFADLFNPALGSVSKLFNFWKDAIFYLPFVVIAASFYLIKTKKIDIQSEGKFFVAVLLFTLILTMQAMTRSDFEHILPSLLMSILLIPLIVKNLNINNKYVIFILLLLFTVPPFVMKARDVNSAYLSHNSVSLKSPVARQIKVNREFGTSYNNLLEFISINIRNESFYSGVVRHDKILINDVILYYLTQKRPPTRYHELHPKQATELKVQLEIIAELKINNINWLVLLRNDIVENNASSRSSKVKALNNYMDYNFELVKIFGNYFVYKRKYLS